MVEDDPFADQVRAHIGQRSAPAEIEIGPDIANAAALFFALDTQWRWHPMGPRTGLIYEAVAPRAAGMGLEMTPEFFADITIMEHAALTAWAERRD